MARLEPRFIDSEISNIIHVHPNSNETKYKPNGTPLRPCRTIQQAINIASGLSSPSLIYLSPGQYVINTPITITTPITISSSSNNNNLVQILPHVSITDMDDIIRIFSDFVKIYNISIFGAKCSIGHSLSSGISIGRKPDGTYERIGNIEINNCVLNGNSHGIYNYGSYNVVIKDTTIINSTIDSFPPTEIIPSGIGIIFYSSEDTNITNNCQIINCDINNNEHSGLYLSSEDASPTDLNVNIKYCKFYQNGTQYSKIDPTNPIYQKVRYNSIFISENNNLINIEENKFYTHPTSAIESWFSPLSVAIRSNNDGITNITKNEFYDNFQGILIGSGTSTTKITKNYFHDNTIGVSMDSSGNPEYIRYNDFENNNVNTYALVPDPISGGFWTPYAIKNNSTNVVDAKHNWFNHETGPDDDDNIIQGQGDKISTNINASPYDGKGAGGGTGTANYEKLIIDISTDPNILINKRISLVKEPKTYEHTEVRVQNGIPLVYNEDFNVIEDTGVIYINWNGLELENLLELTDVLIIEYFY